MRSVVLSILILMPIGALCQQNALFPDAFGVNFNNLALVNTWHVPDSGKADFTGAYKYRTGPFSKIATYSFTAAVVARKQNRRAHVLRLVFFNQKEGPYIQKPRAYLNYVYQIAINEYTSLSAGVALGFASVYFSAPSSTAAGSITLPDGALGLGLKRKNFSIGASSLQVFNAHGTPLTGDIHLNRYYHFFMSDEKELSPYCRIKGYLLWGLIKNNQRRDAALAFVFRDALSLGGVFHYKQGFSFFSSFQSNVGKNVFLLSLAYNTSLFTSASSLQNSMELTVGYKIN
jgi:hypothetical protein